MTPYQTSTDYAELVRRLDTGEVLAVVYERDGVIGYTSARKRRREYGGAYVVGSLVEEMTADRFQRDCARLSLRWLVPPPPVTSELPTEEGMYWCEYGKGWRIVTCDVTDGRLRIDGTTPAYWQREYPNARWQKINPPEVTP